MSVMFTAAACSNCLVSFDHSLVLEAANRNAAGNAHAVTPMPAINSMHCDM